MATRSTTSTVVRLNAKIESVNLLRAPSFPGGTVINEGEVFYLSSTGNPTKLSSTNGGDPAGVASPAYINFVTSSRSDVQDAQSFPMGNTDSASVSLDSGGLSGIIGNDVVIGLPKSMFASGATFTQGGHLIPSSTDGKFDVYVTVPDIISPATSASGGDVTLTYKWSYGVIVRVEGEIVWFLFHSTPTLMLVDVA